MDLERRLALLKDIGEEIVTEDDLRGVLETKKHPVAYDGYEPSGMAHLPFIYRAMNLENLLKAGVKFKLLLADWHAFLNNKMGGDIEKIREVGFYFTEVYKAAGVDFDKVELVWVNDLLDKDYMEKVLKIAQKTSLNRMLRCTTIMGRNEKDKLSTGQVFYPAMQAADIYKLGVDICQLGLDQRRVNVLAREIGPKLGWWKPAVLSHRMLMGLQPQAGEGSDIQKQIKMKMSKSKPQTCIYLHDSGEKIKSKINKAYCPEKKVENNPILEYSKYLIFKKFPVMKIDRPEKFGGDIEFENYGELEKRYKKGEIHPLDLKKAVGKYINEMVKPVREHFEKNKRAKKLYETVKKQEVTR